MIKVLRNEKTENYRKLKQGILSPEFSWYWVLNATTTDLSGHDNFGYYSHTVLRRPGDGVPRFYSVPSSNVLELANDVIYEILRGNNIEPKVFYRINVNCVHPTERNLPSAPHHDHDIPHKNLLIYLTDPNEGETFVEGESYLGHEDAAIVFEGLHYHKPPKRGRRVVIVCTFLA